MFDMTDTQKQAFSDATSGMSAISLNHLVLYLIGALATIWLAMIFVGTFKNRQKEVSEQLTEFAFAVFLFTCIGVVVYFT